MHFLLCSDLVFGVSSLDISTEELLELLELLLFLPPGKSLNPMSITSAGSLPRILQTITIISLAIDIYREMP